MSNDIIDRMNDLEISQEEIERMLKTTHSYKGLLSLLGDKIRGEQKNIDTQDSGKIVKNELKLLESYNYFRLNQKPNKKTLQRNRRFSQLPPHLNLKSGNLKYELDKIKKLKELQRRIDRMYATNKIESGEVFTFTNKNEKSGTSLGLIQDSLYNTKKLKSKYNKISNEKVLESW